MTWQPRPGASGRFAFIGSCSATYRWSRRSAALRAAMLILVTSTGIGTAQAGCPPAAPGNTAGEIQANGDRLVCLQNELAAETRARHEQLQRDALEKQRQDLEIRRRLDALPQIPIDQPPALPAAPGM